MYLVPQVRSILAHVLGDEQHRELDDLAGRSLNDEVEPSPLRIPSHPLIRVREVGKIASMAVQRLGVPSPPHQVDVPDLPLKDLRVGAPVLLLHVTAFAQ